MAEFWIQWAVIYLLPCALFFVLGFLNYYLPAGENEKKWGARFILFAMVWPLALVAFIGYGLHKVVRGFGPLIRTAFDKED